MCVTLCLCKWSMCFFSIVQIWVQAGKNKKNTILVILDLIRLEDSVGEEKQQSHFLCLHCPSFNALHFFFARCFFQKWLHQKSTCRLWEPHFDLLLAFYLSIQMLWEPKKVTGSMKTFWRLLSFHWWKFRDLWICRTQKLQLIVNAHDIFNPTAATAVLTTDPPQDSWFLFLISFLIRFLFRECRKCSMVPYSWNIWQFVISCIWYVTHNIFVRC